MKLGVANGGKPIPSGLGRMVHSTSHNRRREGRHPPPNEIRCPPPGHAADRHSCAQRYGSKTLALPLDLPQGFDQHLTLNIKSYFTVKFAYN